MKAQSSHGGLTWHRLLYALRGGARLDGLEDEGTARGFHLMLVCALVWISVLITTVFPLFAIRKAATTILALLFGALVVGALHLLRQRRLRAAALLFLPFLWCLAEVICALNGGVGSFVQALVVLIIVDTGWMLGKANAIRLAAATLIIALAETALDVTGHPLPLYLPGAPLVRCIFFAGMLFFALGPILAILDVLQQRVSALHQSEERFHTIVDSVNEAIFVHDEDTGQVVEVNQRACEMYGYPASEMMTLPPDRLSEGTPPYSAAEALGHLARARTGSPQVFEWRARRSDGCLFWVEVAIRRARVLGAQRLVVVVRDITERKRAEEDRAHIEEQLRQAQKMESVGQLAAGVAHDFNNLLTVINGYSGLLAKRVAADAPLRRLAEQILHAGARAAGLTSQLLAFSRKQPVRYEVVDVNRLILDARRMLETLLGEGIELSMELEPGLGSILADQSQMHQVLMNLAANARDAMSGSGRFRIATEHRQPPAAADLPATPGGSEWIALSVSDTGCGMDAATRARVFEPFFTTKQVGKGTGLGLATVYGIVRQSGGWIEVESEPAQGAKFRIYLPLTHTPRADGGKAAAPAIHPRVSSTILLVEDQPSVREFLSLVLREAGYHVLTTGTPGEALTVLEQNHQSINAVVSDVIMPGMTGPEMAQRMRKILPGLHVLFVSGYPAEAITGTNALLDGWDYLAKPVDPAVLLSRLDALIRQT